MVDRAPLRDALAALAAEPDDPRRREAVFQQLLEGRLLAGLSVPDRDVEQPEGVVAGELHLVAIPRDDAEPTVLGFTGEEPFRRFGLPGPKAVVRLPAFWAFLVERGLRSATIDPGGPIAVTLHEHELTALADGRVPREGAVEPPRIVLRALRGAVPQAVADAVMVVAEGRQVRAAHLLEGDGWPDARHLVVALELTPTADRDATLAHAWAALEAVGTGEGWRLSATVLESWESGLIRATSAAAEPAPRDSGPPSPA